MQLHATRNIVEGFTVPIDEFYPVTDMFAQLELQVSLQR